MEGVSSSSIVWVDYVRDLATSLTLASDVAAIVRSMQTSIEFSLSAVLRVATASLQDMRKLTISSIVDFVKYMLLFISYPSLRDH